MQLSPHFSLEEMTVSETAARRGISNTPPAAIVQTLRKTCALLEQIRRLVSRPVVVTSGYRSPAVNTAVGGAANSAHVYGRAADIHVPGLSIRELAEAICKSSIPFDKLILEFGAWVHIQIPADGKPARREVYTKDATHDYTPGLH